MKKYFFVVSIVGALMFSNQAVFAQSKADDALSKTGEGLKKFGKKFADAVSSTFNDAVSAVKGESSEETSDVKGVSKIPTYFVSFEKGSNQNDGKSSQSPFKNIQKAIDSASDGSEIRVARGNYYGTLNCGNILVNKSVKIVGGYSDDFSERDVKKYPSLIQPSPESNNSQDGKGTMSVCVKRQGADVVIDGLVFDRGNTIAYSPENEGQPEGVSCPRMMLPGTRGVGGEGLKTEVRTVETAELFVDNIQGNLTVRNCCFVNAPYYAISGSINGKADISNNVFVAVRMAAVELSGSSLTRNSEIKFSRNTVFFAWSRLKDMADMGYGLRCMTGTDCFMDYNVFACVSASGIDRSRTELLKDVDAKRETTSEHNLFFQNLRGDICIASGENTLMARVADFSEVEVLTKNEDNKAVKDLSEFGGNVDEAYYKGFISAKGNGSMFMNRYPLNKALSLFGACEGYGARKPGNK